MGWIDADAHVVEGPHTWDYLPSSEQRYRPVLCDVQPASGKQAWYIDGKMRGLVPGLPKDDEKFKGHRGVLGPVPWPLPGRAGGQRP